MFSPQSCVGEKRRKMGGVNMDSLPDDLVLNILGRLELRDAATTALVSPRLLNVWSFSTHLDFKDDADPRQPSLSGIHFMKFVNFILNRHRASSVDSLRIAFDAVGIEETDDVLGSLEKWVEFARLKSVRSLEIDLHHSAAAARRVPPATSGSPFCFPLHELYGLKTLTSLSLNYILILDEDDIVYLLERSLLSLETFVIENASCLQNLKIKAQKLKHLEIRYCPNLLSIDIVSAPNLQSFHKAADFNIRVQVSFCCNLVPNLSNVNLRGLLCPNLLLELQEYAPCLEKLELDLCAGQSNQRCSEFPELYPLIGDLPIQFPQLRNLKQLGLNFNASNGDAFMDLMFIIAACPNLQDLTLYYANFSVWEEERDHHWDKPSSYTHTSLATVTFVGCVGSHGEFEFASYLMEIAKNLRMVTFDSNPSVSEYNMGYREWKFCTDGKYSLWKTYLWRVKQFIDSKPVGSVAFRCALPRLLPKDWGVPRYEDLKDNFWVKRREYEKCYLKGRFPLANNVNRRYN